MKKISATNNKERKWNEASVYYPVELEVEGKPVWFMFTEHQLNTAKKRAERNPEDIPQEEEESLLGKLFNWCVR